MKRRCVALVLVLIATGTDRAHALCGDATGEGYITASDGLAALTAAVAGDYEAKLDVATTGTTDGRVTATDALMILGAAVAPLVPDCAAADERAAIVSAASSTSCAGAVRSGNRTSAMRCAKCGSRCSRPMSRCRWCAT